MGSEVKGDRERMTKRRERRRERETKRREGGYNSFTGVCVCVCVCE